MCGIAGIKPTYGRVSRAGVSPAAFSLDHTGLMAWTTEDCAMMLQVLAGYDASDSTSSKMAVPSYTETLGGGARGLKIGVIHHFHEADNKVSPGTQKGIDEAIATFKGLGADIHDITISPLQDSAACGSIISMTQRPAAYDEMMRANLDKFGERLRNRLLMSLFISGVDHVQATRLRRELCAELACAMAGVDVQLTAVQAKEAPHINNVPQWENLEKPNFTMPFNVSGYPAISICSGFGAGGLPVAMQLIAKPFAEAKLFQVAHAYEQTTEWRRIRPNLDFTSKMSAAAN